MQYCRPLPALSAPSSCQTDDKMAKIAETVANFGILAGSLIAVAPVVPPPGGPKTLKNLRLFNDSGFEKLVSIKTKQRIFNVSGFGGLNRLPPRGSKIIEKQLGF